MPHEIQGDRVDHGRDETKVKIRTKKKGETHALTTIQQRFRPILERLLEKHGGWRQIEKAIEAAGCGFFDRRKLSAIYVGKNTEISLTMVELQILNSYLFKLHLPGLEGVFRPQTLAASIAQSGTVHFWLAFKPESETETQDAQTWISHWDMQSVMAFTQGLYPEGPAKLKTLIDKVLLEPPNTSHQSLAALLAQRNWHSMLREQAEHDSIIAVGSTKSCHATECLLAEMFGVRPFEPNGRVNELPFRFEFSPILLKDRPSAFAYAAENVPDPSSSRSARTDTYALVFDNERYVKGLTGDEWDDFGVIVSQRRRDGHVWTIVAGLSGPATYAAAEEAAKLEHDFGYQVDDDGNSPVLCCAVRAKVGRIRDGIIAGDNREVDKAELIGKSILWSAEKSPVEPPAPAKRSQKRAKKPR